MNQIKTKLLVILCCILPTSWSYSLQDERALSPLSFSNPLEYFKKVIINQERRLVSSKQLLKSNFNDEEFTQQLLISGLMESNTTSSKCNESLTHFLDDLEQGQFYTIKGILQVFIMLHLDYKL